MVNPRAKVSNRYPPRNTEQHDSRMNVRHDRGSLTTGNQLSSALSLSRFSASRTEAACSNSRLRAWSIICFSKRRISFAKALSSRSNSGRSEEHTSELQSRENLVCRLLLEKK